MKVVNVETLRAPDLYSPEQLDNALRVAYWLSRGRFVLTLEPDKDREHGR